MTNENRFAFDDLMIRSFYTLNIFPLHTQHGYSSSEFAPLIKPRNSIAHYYHD
jgi:hypothetical protein